MDLFLSIAAMFFFANLVVFVRFLGKIDLRSEVVRKNEREYAIAATHKRSEIISALATN